uniref:Uncharacterized protein n=1 Tax=Hirsutella vermicola TaxID=369263 RepID=A0A1S6KM32_9HYPO|nr:hypothetical protein [Hirsutella vermicola]AQT19619.1 hypothetical protein [Hirsutella vermicola]
MQHFILMYLIELPTNKIKVWFHNTKLYNIIIIINIVEYQNIFIFLINIINIQYIKIINRINNCIYFIAEIYLKIFIYPLFIFIDFKYNSIKYILLVLLFIDLLPIKPSLYLMALIVGLIIILYKTSSNYDTLVKLTNQIYESLKIYLITYKKILFIFIIICILSYIWSPILLFLKISILFRILNHLEKIINTNDEKILKIELNNIIPLITILFVLIVFPLIIGLVFIFPYDIKYLLNPMNDQGNNPNNNDGNNPEQPKGPKLPTPNPFKGPNYSKDLENSILQKTNQRINDPTLDHSTNMFDSSGKNHDFTSKEKGYIVCVVNKNMGQDIYIMKTPNMGKYGINDKALSSKTGDCLVLMTSNYKPALNTNTDLKTLAMDIVNGRKP